MGSVVIFEDGHPRRSVKQLFWQRPFAGADRSRQSRWRTRMLKAPGVKSQLSTFKYGPYGSRRSPVSIFAIWMKPDFTRLPRARNGSR